MTSEQLRHFVKYSFYKLRPEWRLLAAKERKAQKEEFIGAYDEAAARTALWSYSLAGLRGDADFMIRQMASALQEVHGLATRLAGTRLAAYANVAYSYLAVTRPSEYVGGHRHPGQEGAEDAPTERLAKYLIVYPFVKSRAWYSLPREERQAMMSEHFRAGHRYPGVRIHTSYSFGIDDQEFLVAFDTDDVMSFVDLVAELRCSKASAFTVRDTPAFTCIAMPLAEALDALDGASVGRFSEAIRAHGT